MAFHTPIHPPLTLYTITLGRTLHSDWETVTHSSVNCWHADLLESLLWGLSTSYLVFIRARAFWLRLDVLFGLLNLCKFGRIKYLEIRNSMCISWSVIWTCFWNIVSIDFLSKFLIGKLCAHPLSRSTELLQKSAWFSCFRHVGGLFTKGAEPPRCTMAHSAWRVIVFYRDRMNMVFWDPFVGYWIWVWHWVFGKFYENLERRTGFQTSRQRGWENKYKLPYTTQVQNQTTYLRRNIWKIQSVPKKKQFSNDSSIQESTNPGLIMSKSFQIFLRIL